MAVSREQILKRLTAHQEEIRANFGVRYLALFGSVARGEAQRGSDVDVLVDFEGLGTFDRYVSLKGFLEELLGRPVDLVTSKALKPRLRRHVRAEAIRVA